MLISFVVLTLPLIAAGARHAGHAKAHRAHDFERRVLQTAIEVITVTEVVTVTADVATTSTAVAELTSASSGTVLPSSIVKPPAAPTNDTKNITTGSQTLVPVGNSAMLKNSCEYPVYLWSDGHPTCEGPAAKAKLIEANGTHIEIMRKCPEGGISLKISKTESAVKPMQFEYTVWPDHETVSYDISYLDCMKNEKGEKDLSECAGHDGGIQAVGGGDCKGFHCPANEWCDTNAYVVAEFGGLDGAPVGACPVEHGIAFELCAGA